MTYKTNAARHRNNVVRPFRQWREEFAKRLMHCRPKCLITDLCTTACQPFSVHVQLYMGLHRVTGRFATRTGRIFNGSCFAYSVKTQAPSFVCFNYSCHSVRMSCWIKGYLLGRGWNAQGANWQRGETCINPT